MSNRVQSDDRLDKLYMKAMRCPYCQTRIERGTTKCANCGITKEQIYHASLKQVRGGRQPVLRSRVRPAHIPYWKMAVAGMFGFTGAHCFVAKRYWRGALILTCLVAWVVMMLIFPEDNAIRRRFEEQTYLFPGDLLMFVWVVLWIVDWIAILFNRFKYPVVLKLENETAHGL